MQVNRFTIFLLLLLTGSIFLSSSIQKEIDNKKVFLKHWLRFNEDHNNEILQYAKQLCRADENRIEAIDEINKIKDELMRDPNLFYDSGIRNRLAIIGKLDSDYIIIPVSHESNLDFIKRIIHSFIERQLILNEINLKASYEILNTEMIIEKDSILFDLALYECLPKENPYTPFDLYINKIKQDSFGLPFKYFLGLEEVKIELTNIVTGEKQEFVKSYHH